MLMCIVTTSIERNIEDWHACKDQPSLFCTDGAGIDVRKCIFIAIFASTGNAKVKVSNNMAIFIFMYNIMYLQRTLTKFMILEA